MYVLRIDLPLQTLASIWIKFWANIGSCLKTHVNTRREFSTGFVWRVSREGGKNESAGGNLGIWIYAISFKTALDFKNLTWSVAEVSG